MIFTETPLRGAFVIATEPSRDERGFFARTWCRREFKAHGLCSEVAQCSVSFNERSGTLRGMHYQAPPYEETRLVRCITGGIFDVIIDLRHDSKTYAQHFATVLSAENWLMVFVPEGFAHGFQTLEPCTEVLYQMSEFYSPEHSRGVRWDDPAFAIAWPAADRTISPRDRSFPDFMRVELKR